MKSNCLYYLAFTCAFFSFAVYTPVVRMNVYDWIIFITANILMCMAAVVIAGRKGKIKPLVSMFLIGYLPFLVARQLNMFNNYVKLYHRNTWKAGNIIITILFVMIIYMLPLKKSGELIYTFFTATLFLIAAAVILNAGKANPVNLYNIERKITPGYESTILFEFLIPFIIISIKEDIKIIKKIGFLALTGVNFILISVFSFSCTGGNILYSLSPLQMLFNMTSGEIISNFDGVFNLLLSFSYFASIFMAVYAYRIIKNDFVYINDAFVLMFLPAVFIIRNITEPFWIIIQRILVLLIAIGNHKRGNYEKN